MKFELDQLIYYFRNNKIHSAPVLCRVCVENLHDDWAHTEQQKYTWQHFGPSGVRYYTCHGEIAESAAFGSKQELIDSL
jgi:hypothetical protein